MDPQRAVSLSLVDHCMGNATDTIRLAARRLTIQRTG